MKTLMYCISQKKEENADFFLQESREQPSGRFCGICGVFIQSKCKPFCISEKENISILLILIQAGSFPYTTIHVACHCVTWAT